MSSRGRIRRVALVLAMGLFLAACSAPPNQLAFAIQATKSDSQVTVEVTDDMALVKVFSRSGIDNATVKLTAGAWPKQVTLRLYLSGLEELRFSYGGTMVQTALASSAPYTVSEQVNRAGAAVQGITAESAYWMKVRVVPGASGTATIPLKDGSIEVDVPADFLPSGAREFHISWIDFYR